MWRVCSCFSSFAYLLLPFVFFSCLLVLLSSCSLAWLPVLCLVFCPLVLSCLFLCPCGFCRCFLFPYGLYAKERAQRFCPLCPLLSCYVGLYSCVVIKKFRCRCFGFFQFVRLVLPTNTTGVGRLARSYFDFLRHYVDITYNRSAFLK